MSESTLRFSNVASMPATRLTVSAIVQLRKYKDLFVGFRRLTCIYSHLIPDFDIPLASNFIARSTRN